MAMLELVEKLEAVIVLLEPWERNAQMPDVEVTLELVIVLLELDR